MTTMPEQEYRKAEIQSLDMYNRALDKTKRFARNLKALRKWHRISQDKLAAKLGVSTTTVSAYETGRATVNFAIAIMICEVFKVDLDDMLARRVYRDGFKRV